jgi:hypothetical protein
MSPIPTPTAIPIPSRLGRPPPLLLGRAIKLRPCLLLCVRFCQILLNLRIPLFESDLLTLGLGQEFGLEGVSCECSQTARQGAHLGRCFFFGTLLGENLVY